MIKKIMMTTKLLLFAPCFLLAQYSQAKMNELALEMRVTTTKALYNAAKKTVPSQAELRHCSMANVITIKKICTILASIVPQVVGGELDFKKKTMQYQRKCLDLAPGLKEFNEQNNASINLKNQLDNIIAAFHESQDTNKIIQKPETLKENQNQEDTSKNTKKSEADTIKKKVTLISTKKKTQISIGDMFKKIASKKDNVKIQFLIDHKRELKDTKPDVIKAYLKALDQKLSNDYEAEKDQIKMFEKASQYLHVFNSMGVKEKKYDFMSRQYDILRKTPKIGSEVSLWKNATDENSDSQTRLEKLKQYQNSYPAGIYRIECLQEIFRLENQISQDKIIKKLETSTIKKLVDLYKSSSNDKETIDSIIWNKVKIEDNFLCYNYYRMKIKGKFISEASEEMQKKLPWFFIQVLILLAILAGMVWGALRLLPFLTKKMESQVSSEVESKSENESNEQNAEHNILDTDQPDKQDNINTIENFKDVTEIIIPPIPVDPPKLPKLPDEISFFSPEPHPDGYFDGFRFSDTKEGCLFEMNIPKDVNTATFRLIDSPEVVQILINNDFANIRQACDIIGYHRSEDGSYKTKFKGKEGKLVMEGRRRWRIEKKCEISFDGVK